MLLDGLDYFVAEMGRRGLRAVLYLGNFWEWSGGLMTYLSYVDGGRYTNMNDPAHHWPIFPGMASGFYCNPAVVALYRDLVRAVVGRTKPDHMRALSRRSDDHGVAARQRAAPE